LISFCLLWHCLRSCYFCKAVSLFSRPPPRQRPPLFCFVFLQIFCVIFKADNDDSQRRWRHFVSHPEDFHGRRGWSGRGSDSGRWVMPKYLSTCTHSGAKAGSRIQMGITGQALGQHHHCHQAAL